MALFTVANSLTLRKQPARGNMVTLCCAIVGERGNVLSIDIDASMSVGDLKEAIKKKMRHDGKAFSARELELFLAKNGDAWLPGDDQAVQDLEDGKADNECIWTMTDKKNKMNETRSIQECLDEKNMPAPQRRQLHVLVVVREGTRVERSANVLFEALQDSTDEWLAKFHARRIKFALLPAAASLPEFIEQPLPVKIRIPRNVLASWSSLPIPVGDQLQMKMFVEDDATPCRSFTRLVINQNMLEPLRSGTTKKSFIWFWDTMIRSVLDFMFSEAHITRDSSRGLSTAKKRPDFSFILNEVCVFRGEEKQPGVDIEMPRLELEQLKWSYGKVPYLFGYAASGFKVCLCALTRGRSDAAGATATPLGLFNLEVLTDRFRLVLALLNLCLLFPAIAEACSDSGRNEYRNVRCYNGVVVRLNPTYVEKVFPNEEGFDQLEHIYRVIRNANVPNVDRLIELKRTTKTATFEPRGTNVQPSTLMELFVALRNVLEALVVLHRELVIHRDIRWPNVIKRRDCDAWFLIDFADAATSPQHFPSGQHLSEEEHAPEIFVSGSIHTTAVDIWAVGYLIDTSDVRWDDLAERTAFTKRLLQKDPTTRPTAEEALRDLAKLQEEATQEQLMIENLGRTQHMTRKRKQETASNEATRNNLAIGRATGLEIPTGQRRILATAPGKCRDKKMPRQS